MKKLSWYLWLTAILGCSSTLTNPCTEDYGIVGAIVLDTVVVDTLILNYIGAEDGRSLGSDTLEVVCVMI